MLQPTKEVATAAAITTQIGFIPGCYIRASKTQSPLTTLQRPSVPDPLRTYGSRVYLNSDQNCGAA